MPGSTTSSAQYLRSDHIGITSPVTPRRPTTYTDGDQTELSLVSASQDKNNSLKPSSNMPYSQSNDNFLIPEPRRLESQPSDDPWSPSISSPIDSARFIPCSSTNPKAHLDYDKPTKQNKLGTFSAINIILGKTIGVGIYSVPSSIYAGVGSVGMTLLVWIIGAAISFCGLAVYLDLGTALPRSEGTTCTLSEFSKDRKCWRLVSSWFTWRYSGLARQIASCWGNMPCTPSKPQRTGGMCGVLLCLLLPLRA